MTHNVQARFPGDGGFRGSSPLPPKKCSSTPPKKINKEKEKEKKIKEKRKKGKKEMKEKGRKTPMNVDGVKITPRNE